MSVDQDMEDLGVDIEIDTVRAYVLATAPRLQRQLERWTAYEPDHALKRGLKMVHMSMTAVTGWCEAAAPEVASLYGHGKAELDDRCACTCGGAGCSSHSRQSPPIADRVDWERKRQSRAMVSDQHCAICRSHSYASSCPGGGPRDAKRGGGSRQIVQFNAGLVGLLQAYKTCVDARRVTEDQLSALADAVVAAISAYDHTYRAIQPHRAPGAPGRKWQFETGFLLNLPFDYFGHALRARLRIWHNKWENTDWGREGDVGEWRNGLRGRLEALGKHRGDAGDGSGGCSRADRERWMSRHGDGQRPRWVRRSLPPVRDEDEARGEEEEEEEEDEVEVGERY